MKRLEPIDAWRGLAIVLMVVNHVGHYLAPTNRPGWDYFLVYLTVTLAGPFFLFLAGFSLALSTSRAKEKSLAKTALFSRLLKRGLGLVALGFLINLFFYYHEPLWRGRILETIGLGIILAYPFVFLESRVWRRIWLVIAISGLLVFPLFYPFLAALTQVRPLIATVFFSEFPLYPWFFLLLVGLLAGQEYLAGNKPLQAKPVLLGGGTILLFSWLAVAIIIYGGNIFSFLNDYNLNGYWNPSPLTWLWIFGWLSLAAFCLLVLQAKKLLPRYLIEMGQTALFLYFLQFFLIITIAATLLEIRTANLATFTLLNILIIFILCLSAKFRLFVKNTISIRPRPKARIF